MTTHLIPLQRPPSIGVLADGWRLARREGTGLFAISPHGTLLFRVDLAAGLIYCWDKRAGREVPVDVRALFTSAAT